MPYIDYNQSSGLIMVIEQRVPCYRMRLRYYNLCSILDKGLNNPIEKWWGIKMVFNSRKTRVYRDIKQCVWCYSDIIDNKCSNKNCNHSLKTDKKPSEVKNNG